MTDWRQQMEQVVRPAVTRSTAIQEIVVDLGALAQAAALHRRCFGDRPALIIADENTWQAAGGALAAALESGGIAVRSHLLPGRPRPKPSVELGTSLADVMAEDDSVPHAVGSGVINDLVKFAAHRLNRPYLCVATAASMDGYASAGAPLTDQGFKKTIDCRAPQAILADLEVIAAAPAEMTGWGYGDLAGKLPAGADWLVADALGAEPIDATAWSLVQDHLPDWLAAADAVAERDPGAIAGLFAGLTIAGLAMEVHGTSRPASGADHQIAHIWEMESLTHQGEGVSHGACVAVGCVTTLALFDWLLGQDLTRLSPERTADSAPSLSDKNAWIDLSFPSPEIAARAKLETAAKHLDPTQHCGRIAALTRCWPDLRRRLEDQLMRAPEMAALLHRAGAPAKASEIGVTPDRHRRTVISSRFIRSRYTVLDLLAETGLLEAALDAVFSDSLLGAA